MSHAVIKSLAAHCRTWLCAAAAAVDNSTSSNNRIDFSATQRGNESLLQQQREIRRGWGRIHNLYIVQCFGFVYNVRRSRTRLVLNGILAVVDSISNAGGVQFATVRFEHLFKREPQNFNLRSAENIKFRLKCSIVGTHQHKIFDFETVYGGSNAHAKRS